MTLGPDLPEVSDADWARTPASVRRLVAVLVERIARLEARVAEQDREIASLREQLGKNSRNSSKPPSSDPPGAPPPPPAKPSKNKRGGQKGHTKHSRERLPADRVVPCVPEACFHCEHPLEGRDPEPDWHQVVEIPVILREVTEYQMHALECPRCRQTTLATLPEGVSQSAFGSRLHGLVALLTGHHRQSKRLVSEMLEEVFQIPMSLGAVSRCEARVSAALAGPYDEALGAARKAPWANVDETSWRENKQRAWLWVMATTFLTVLMVHRNRSKEAAQKLLGEDFAGITITDRYSAYLWVDVECRQLCWSHLDRDFQAMVDRGGHSREVGLALQHESDRMFKWWAWVKQGRRDRAWLVRTMPGLQRAVRAALEAGMGCGEATTSGVCREILALFPALWTFVTVEGVEPTNNLAERELRPAVQMRKLSFGTDSAVGSRFFERIMTVVMTLRRQKRGLLNWLAEAFDAFRLRRPVPSLLPQPP
jgi:transposase